MISSTWMLCILTDLSKAFEFCRMPHMYKIVSYGANKKNTQVTCKLHVRYITKSIDRRLRDRRKDLSCDFVYNIFIDDLILRVTRNSDIYKYADDNTVSACDKQMVYTIRLQKFQAFFCSGLQNIFCRQMLLNFNILC